jgi:hypothetical protein
LSLIELPRQNAKLAFRGVAEHVWSVFVEPLQKLWHAPGMSPPYYLSVIGRIPLL